MRSRASPMKRTRPARRSSNPPIGSCSLRSAETDSAFIVKSRRRASSSKSRPKRTVAWRPSVAMSRRNVVTSNGCPRTTTVIVPCSTPVGTGLNPARFARAITVSGNAVVARSTSPVDNPMSALRTAPPMIRVSSPSPFSTSRMSRSRRLLNRAAIAFSGSILIRNARARVARSRHARAHTRLFRAARTRRVQ